MSILRFPFVEGRPLLHWAHATGFHAETYRPLLEGLSQYFNVLAWDMRGHGESGAAADPDQLRDWEVFYEDLQGVISAHGQSWILAGHSVGAVCSLMVAARLGSAVRGLCLVDPILMHGVAAAGFGILKKLGQGHRHPLVFGALRRRARFASLAEAEQNYSAKRVFASWQEGFLSSYVRGGFRPVNDGVELRCAPAWEARQFATTEHDPWAAVGNLQCPVLLVQGARDSTIFPGAVRKFRALHTRTGHRLYPDTSHFVPMEASQRLVAEIAEEFSPHGRRTG